MPDEGQSGRTRRQPGRDGSSPWSISLLSAVAACVPADRSDSLSAIPFDDRVTVYDVRSGSVDSYETVTLTGLVANTDRREGGTALLAQDPAGGSLSGIELVLHHPLPGVEIAVGDLLTVRGLVGSRDGRTMLVVEEADGITRTGSASPTPTPVTTVADWEPLHAAVVEVDALELLDCGQADGRLSTSAGLWLDPIELDRLDDGHGPVDLGPGELRQVRGVVAGSAGSWHLRPRFLDDLPESLPGGCPHTIGAALSAEVRTRTALDRVVVTGVHQPGDSPRAFVQDPEGGAGRGLELRSSRDFGEEVGEEIQVVGLLSEEAGRPVLWVDGLRPHPEPLGIAPVPSVFDDTVDPALWQGVLVSFAALQLLEDTSTGEVLTDAGLVLSPRLLPADTALPTDSEVDVSGIFVQPPDDALPLLMPRSSEDWASAD